MARLTGGKVLNCIVVFQGSDNLGPWQVFAPPGWRHCWIGIATYFPEPGLMANQWTKRIEPTTWGIDVDFHFISLSDAAQQAYRFGATSVLKISVDTTPRRSYVPRGFLSCVSVLKAILGLRACWIVTPKQLHRFLRRNGAIEVENDGKSENPVHRHQGAKAG